MGTRETARSVVVAIAFIRLVAWNAVLQTKYKSNLEEFDQKLKAHDGNFQQVEGMLKTYDSNFEQVKGKLEKHDNSFKKQEILMKSIDEEASRRMKRSLNTHPQITGGATYIRWGRTVCPDDAELVYKGFAGGEHYVHTGGGSEYLCLSDDPKYAKHGSTHKYGANIYGVEIEQTGMNKVLLDTTNARLSPLHNSDVQCAVCRSRSETSMVGVANPLQVMIPGTNECSDGWKMEYWGYLMTGNFEDNAQHSYACLDHAPEAGTDGGARNSNGALMYHVRGKCGSLPCTPYHPDYELTCVVCTK